MWFLAFSSIRYRWVSFVGVFVTVLAAATLVTATGSLLEAGIRGATPPERLAGVDIVVAADQTVAESRGSGEDHETVRTAVTERVRLPADLGDEIASLPGVAAAVGEVSFPAYVEVDGAPLSGPGGTPSLGHAWTTAGVTPFRLAHGTAPEHEDDVVIDAGLARRGGLDVGDTTPAVVAGQQVELV